MSLEWLYDRLYQDSVWPYRFRSAAKVKNEKMISYPSDTSKVRSAASELARGVTRKRDPTPKMIAAGKIPLRSISGFVEEEKLAAIWRAMVDAMVDEPASSRQASPAPPSPE
jgi:hypothetical protein